MDFLSAFDITVVTSLRSSNRIERAFHTGEVASSTLAGGTIFAQEKEGDSNGI